MRIALPASGSGLGGVRFNERVVDGLVDLLGDELDVIRVGSLRSADEGVTKRLPMSVLERLPLAAVRTVGATVWGGAPLHRMDIRLPPARNEVVTVLDFAPLHYDDEGSIADWVVPSIRRAKGALCLSPTVAEEVQRIADIPTWVTGAGVDQRFLGAAPLETGGLARLGITGPFALSMGGTTQRKNLALLRDCWGEVRRETALTLVSIGPNTDQRRRLFDGVEGVLVLDQIPDEVIPGLLSAARLLVIPSLYEGFGMSVVEAMTVGTPVVATNRASLPWVAGDAALVVEPAVEEFAAAVVRAHTDDACRRRLIGAGATRGAIFTWAAVIRKHTEAYAECGF